MPVHNFIYIGHVEDYKLLHQLASVDHSDVVINKQSNGGVNVLVNIIDACIMETLMDPELCPVEFLI